MFIELVRFGTLVSHSPGAALAYVVICKTLQESKRCSTSCRKFKEFILQASTSFTQGKPRVLHLNGPESTCVNGVCSNKPSKCCKRTMMDNMCFLCSSHMITNFVLLDIFLV